MSAAQLNNNNTNAPSSSAENISNNLFDMLSTTVEWMLDTREMDRNYHECKQEIDRLEKLSSNELAILGITRDQIPVFVFSNLFDNNQSEM